MPYKDPAVRREKAREYCAAWRERHPGKAQENCRRWYKRTPLVQRDIHYRRRYGLSLAQYEAMVVARHGLCDICKQVPAKGRLVIDHEHATGMVRGLLCSNCNSAIGMFKDDVSLMKAGIQYVEGWTRFKDRPHLELPG